MTSIRRLEPHSDIAGIFAAFAEETEIAFLDSSMQSGTARFSILGTRPYMRIAYDDELRVDGVTVTGDPREFLRDFFAKKTIPNDTHLPIIDGAIGFMTYDYGMMLENVSSRHEDSSDLPGFAFLFFDCFIIADHEEKSTFLVANGHLEDSEEALDRMERRIAGIHGASTLAEATATSLSEDSIAKSDCSREKYEETVREVTRHIVDGDIYVMNLSRRISIRSRIPPRVLFERLRNAHPSPLGAYVQFAELTAVSSSPERFLRVTGNRVETRPIKGTRPRGRTQEEDAGLREELSSSIKDRSELMMIVDLERNDLNKVCIPGSVQVTDANRVEEYASVFQLVTTVEGVLSEDKNAVDALHALFPGGSITGAPKRRAMEIIDQLEKSRRGLYTGAIGYLSLNGDADFSVVIRTLVHRGDEYVLGTGGGITYESDPIAEYEETVQKAAPFLHALGVRDIDASRI